MGSGDVLCVVGIRVVLLNVWVCVVGANGTAKGDTASAEEGGVDLKDLHRHNSTSELLLDLREELSREGHRAIVELLRCVPVGSAVSLGVAGSEERKLAWDRTI